MNNLKEQIFEDIRTTVYKKQPQFYNPVAGVVAHPLGDRVHSQVLRFLRNFILLNEQR